MSHIDIELLFKGNQRTLYAITRNGECQARQYIDSLSDSDKKRIIALLEYTSNNGPPKNIEKFRHLKDKLYEFKAGKARLICFFQRNMIIILTHGFDKPKPKKLKAEIDIADKIMQEFLEKGGGLP